MLHKNRVLRALKGNSLRKLRKLSGLKARPKLPVLNQQIDRVVERHANLCRLLQSLIPSPLKLDGTVACEVGPGDCLANASLLLGLGAAHVDLIEHEPPVVNTKQTEVLKTIKNTGIPLDLQIIGTDSTLDPGRVSYHLEYMENYKTSDRYSLVCSFNVLEHVESLCDFFSSCYAATKFGGYNIHMIDLGGHGEFEDPLPPLDFQTYPDWLYDMMFPPYHRATRRFVSDYLGAMTSAGFEVVELRKLRTAEPDYLKAIRPKLRFAAQSVPEDEIAVIEFVIIAKKLA